MKRSLIFLLVAVFSVFPGFSGFAQTSASKPLKQCDALMARQLIEQQADFSRTLGETSQRVNVLIKVADFLWLSDQAAARRYFAEAFQVAQAHFREKGLEKNETKKGLIVGRPEYRFMVIEAIAKRDGEWAKRLSETVLKEFDEDQEKDKRGEFQKDVEVQQLLGIASRAAQENPALAQTLARRVMNYPVTHIWYSNLFQMAGKNQPLADSIYAELLGAHADAEVYRLLYLSAYPFGRERIFGIEKYSLGTSVPANFSPNPDLQRQFLVTLLRRVLRLTPENVGKSLQTDTPESAVAVIALNEIEPVAAQQFPNLMPMFNQAKLHANSVVSNEIMEAADKRNETGQSFNQSFAEKLKSVEEADNQNKLKDSLIYHLAISAKKEEDFKAAETWLDKIKDETARSGVINYFYYRRSKLATEEKRFDEAAKFADKVAALENRAVLYFDVAEAKLSEADRKYEASGDLLEVYKMAAKAPDSVEKAQVLLGLANVYEKINHFNALDALSLAVKTANALENPNLFSSFQVQQIKGKDFMFYAGYDVPGFDLNKTFDEISRNDFQGALGRAESFSDKYLRTLAVMAVVKGCEKNTKPAKPKAKTK